MVSDFIQKNTTILRILLLITGILYYVSSTSYANGVNVLLKNHSSVKTLNVEEGESLSNILEKSATKAPKSKNFKIVIDAGHGGHDSGAVGKNALEKDLVLQMALKLEKQIRKSYPEIEVLQTRTTDVFIPLFRRIQYANEQKADLFISIHCNFIANSKTRGTETFVMGLHRAGENLEVAKRENAAILLESNYEANYEGYDPNSPEGHIMMSMYQNSYLDKSIEFAADVEEQFGTLHMSKSRGVKQAGFAVLRRASMPAVLVEAGFLSNEIEEAFLISDEGQNIIAESLLRAVGAYYNNNKNPKKEVTKTKEEEVKEIIEKSQKPVLAKVQNKTEVTTPLSASSTAVYYKVQIAAFKHEMADMDTPELKKIGKLSMVKLNDVNKYLVGDFVSRESAEIAREKLKNLGYKGAFLVVLNQ
jgi:N-acetylmuramoyl-L-alanine amidase